MIVLKILLALVITIYTGISFFIILPLFILHFFGIENPYIIWESIFDFLLETYSHT